jgi:hypothetical protein
MLPTILLIFAPLLVSGLSKWERKNISARALQDMFSMEFLEHTTFPSAHGSTDQSEIPPLSTTGAQSKQEAILDLYLPTLTATYRPSHSASINEWGTRNQSVIPPATLDSNKMESSSPDLDPARLHPKISAAIIKKMSRKYKNTVNFLTFLNISSCLILIAVGFILSHLLHKITKIWSLLKTTSTNKRMSLFHVEETPANSNENIPLVTFHSQAQA